MLRQSAARPQHRDEHQHRRHGLDRTLKDVGVDARENAAGGGVGQHDRRADQHAGGERDAEDRFEHQAEGKQVGRDVADRRDQDRDGADPLRRARAVPGPDRIGDGDDLPHLAQQAHAPGQRPGAHRRGDRCRERDEQRADADRIEQPGAADEDEARKRRGHRRERHRPEADSRPRHEEVVGGARSPRGPGRDAAAHGEVRDGNRDDLWSRWRGYGDASAAAGPRRGSPSVRSGFGASAQCAGAPAQLGKRSIVEPSARKASAKQQRQHQCRQHAHAEDLDRDPERQAEHQRAAGVSAGSSTGAPNPADDHDQDEAGDQRDRCRCARPDRSAPSAMVAAITSAEPAIMHQTPHRGAPPGVHAEPNATRISRVPNAISPSATRIAARHPESHLSPLASLAHQHLRPFSRRRTPRDRPASRRCR